MPELTPEMIAQWGGEIFVFPNLLILPNAGNAMIYRIRPDGVNLEGVKPLQATVKIVTDPADPAQLPLIPRQDFGNVPRVQKGLHSVANKQVWLGQEHEKIIRNQHEEVDRYILGQK